MEESLHSTIMMTAKEPSAGDYCPSLVLPFANTIITSRDNMVDEQVAIIAQRATGVVVARNRDGDGIVGKQSDEVVKLCVDVAKDRVVVPKDYDGEDHADVVTIEDDFDDGLEDTMIVDCE
ncbi:hypothetical protein AMTR_s00020p00225890 [Amborella trichopoda]|uniref:Uncharacterized protein n=1 Tax=Amborella trichopoda TaxID=13333 RepID=W1PV11_AMBTC|nr:hypothetical protein AMTR_s00020p00225890 [Amborella trichopoda]